MFYANGLLKVRFPVQQNMGTLHKLLFAIVNLQGIQQSARESRF